MERIPEKGASTAGLRRPGSGDTRQSHSQRVGWDSIRAKILGEHRETEGGQQAGGLLQVKAEDAGLRAILSALPCLSQKWEQWGRKAKEGTQFQSSCVFSECKGRSREGGRRSRVKSQAELQAQTRTSLTSYEAPVACLTLLQPSLHPGPGSINSTLPAPPRKGPG